MRLPVLPKPALPWHLLDTLPRLTMQPLARFPFLFQRLVLEHLLKQVFHEAIVEGDFDFLQGRFVKVEIHDIRLCWYFSFDGKQLTVHRYARSDTRIRGDLREFLLLVTRQEDPDTLFFQRRLQIDGDTELGLEVKNLLDAVELPGFTEPFITGLRKFQELAG